MDFARVSTIIAVVILIIHPVSATDCSPSTGTLTCECTATSIECSGTQAANTSELEDVLTSANFSELDTVLIKIDDLKFGPDFTFENTSLRKLTLGYGLETIPSHFFLESSSLVSLNIENNNIQDIDDQLFYSLSALEELFLGGNRLRNLTSSMFSTLTNLKLLSVSKNDLQEMNEDVLKDLPALETLILSHNNISSLGDLRMISQSLTELNATNCSMSGALEKDTFSGLPNLERLFLSHNELSEVKPHSLFNLKDLKILDLSYNNIQRLHNNAFSEMKNLKSLDLKYNRISVLKETCFENLKNLVYLDLSSNSLTAVLCQYTTHFDSLEKIYLQDNRIKTFTQGAFYYSPNLQVLNITGNNLECSCPLTDSALYLIANSTMKKEDLESVSCIIPSNPPTLSTITDYKSSKCSTPTEQCKRQDDATTEDYDDYDYNNEASTTTSSSDSNTTILSFTTVTESITNDVTYASPNNTEPVTEITNLSITTSLSSDATSDIPVTSQSNESNSISTTNGSTISGIPVETESTETASIPTTTNGTAGIPVTTESTTTSELSSTSLSNVSTVKTTSNILTTDFSDANITFNHESAAIETTPSSGAEGDICSSLDLSVQNVSLDTKLKVFKNFSYDGHTFCLKWTILGDLTDIWKCVVKYTYKGGTKPETTECPLASNEIKTWSLNEEIFKICVEIYAKKLEKTKKTSDCSPTLLGKTSTSTATISTSDGRTPIQVSEKMPPVVTETSPINVTKTISTSDGTQVTEKMPPVVTETSPTNVTKTISTYGRTPIQTMPPVVAETTPSKRTETVSPTDKPAGYEPSFSVIAINVYFNNSNLAFVTWFVNAEEPFHECNMTLYSSTPTHPMDYDEGIFPCKNNSHQLRSVKERDIFRVCIFSNHEKYGKQEKCAGSASTALESKGKKEEKDSWNNALIPLICLLVILVIVVTIIIFKNIKKAESKRYNVRAEEGKYDQRVKIRPHSTSDQSIRFSYLARENYDQA